MRLTFDPLLALGLTIASAAATAALIVLLMPVMSRYALARPNARSSHTVPTPQGGGIAIVIAVVAVIAFCVARDTPAFREPWVMAALVSSLALAMVGALDDIRPLPVGPRLLLQFAVASLLVHTLPAGARILHWLPPLTESVLMVVALVWFVNLTNFMDGIDWMTVVEVAPVCAALVIVGMTGLVPELTRVMPVVLALLGGLIGFAPFNRHVARLFLGDVGSLPIGALVGWLLLLLAASGHLAAALILPLYYLCDATITLARRLLRGERISQAHRSHFYQLAVARGFSVPQVTGRVLALNVVLGALAVAAVAVRNDTFAWLALAAGLAATLSVLWEFERGRKR